MEILYWIEVSIWLCYNRKLILAGLLMVWGKLVILYKIITWGGKTNFHSFALCLDTPLCDHRMKAAWNIMAKTAQQDTGVSQILKNQVMLQHRMSTFYEAGLFNEAQCFLTVFQNLGFWLSVALLMDFLNMTSCVLALCPVKHYFMYHSMYDTGDPHTFKSFSKDCLGYIVSYKQNGHYLNWGGKQPW